MKTIGAVPLFPRVDFLLTKCVRAGARPALCAMSYRRLFVYTSSLFGCSPVLSNTYPMGPRRCPQANRSGSRPSIDLPGIPLRRRLFPQASPCKSLSTLPSSSSASLSFSLPLSSLLSSSSCADSCSVVSDHHTRFYRHSFAHRPPWPRHSFTLSSPPCFSQHLYVEPVDPTVVNIAPT